MTDLATIFNIAELIGSILVIVAVFLMFKIARITGWFGAWSVLSTAFILIIVRRILAIYAPSSGMAVELGYVNSLILLLLGVMYVIGFYMLYQIFKKKWLSLEDRQPRKKRK